MDTWGHRWLAVILLAIVLLILILPSVNLCPTALRAARDAALIFCALVVAATIRLQMLSADATSIAFRRSMGESDSLEFGRILVLRC